LKEQEGTPKNHHKDQESNCDPDPSSHLHQAQLFFLIDTNTSENRSRPCSDSVPGLEHPHGRGRIAAFICGFCGRQLISLFYETFYLHVLSALLAHSMKVNPLTSIRIHQGPLWDTDDTGSALDLYHPNRDSYNKYR
jgi:hypothetical protein